MGLFNKLKNALFEEEEIEIPIKETSEIRQEPVIKNDNVIKKTEPEKKQVPVEDILDKGNERDLFSAENTFKFPDFDEEEFATSYKPPIEKEEKKEPVITPKESFERVKPITFDFDKKPKQSRKDVAKKEAVKEETSNKKSFKPSPVISPVYGVLDKNYKKEDIITVKEENIKKKYDVDAIRKKAFGTLEDDIERSFETPKKEFYSRNAKNIDDLLNESADDSIDIRYEKRQRRNESRNLNEAYEEQSIETSRKDKRRERLDETNPEEERKNYSSRIEQELDDSNDLQVLDSQNKSNEQKFEEDTLENDLFDLIDSMYDNREEEEE